MIDLRLGDCLDVMRGLDADSVDAVVTDPPYMLGFMGKPFDDPKDNIAASVTCWREVLRVLKPGAYLLAFGGTRTYHRMVCAIEDAGFEIRDSIDWVYGSGFPKSLDVSKAIDKAAGAEWKEVIGTRHRNVKPYDDGNGWNANNTTGDHAYTAPATNSAREWSGWGTALKPAHEPIVVARKPLSESTVAANVLRWGTGAINVDAGRVETQGECREFSPTVKRRGGILNRTDEMREAWSTTQGRFPANLITDGSAEVVAMFPQSVARPVKPENIGKSGDGSKRGLFGNGSIVQSGYYDSETSAARFFKTCPLDDDDYLPLYYCAKASKAERDAGCEGLEEQKANKNGSGLGRECSLQARKSMAGDDLIRARNHHPTVKPLSLMRYLITLCTRDGATVLDPFCGSGSTGVACVQLSRNFIGCEIDPDYYEISKRRIGAAMPIEIEFPVFAEVER